MKPVLSVVIPTRDRWSSLLRLLGSLANQTGAPEHEIVVVDDGSREPAPALSGIRLIKQDNQGRCAARNRGAQEAAGELVAFLDDDMEVEPDFLARHAAAHDQPGRIVCGEVLLPDAFDGSAFGRFRRWLDRQFEPPEARGREGLVEIDGLSGANMSMRRDDFLRLGGFDVRLRNPGCEDYEFHVRARAAGLRTLYAPGLLSWHHDAFLDLRSYAARQRLYTAGWVQLISVRPDMLERAPRFWTMCLDNDRRLLGELPLRRRAAVTLKHALDRAGALEALYGMADGLERVHCPDRVLRPLYLRILSLETLRGYREGVYKYLGGALPTRSAT